MMDAAGWNVSYQGRPLPKTQSAGYVGRLLAEGMGSEVRDDADFERLFSISRNGMKRLAYAIGRHSVELARRCSFGGGSWG